MLHQATSSISLLWPENAGIVPSRQSPKAYFYAVALQSLHIKQRTSPHIPKLKNRLLPPSSAVASPCTNLQLRLTAANGSGHLSKRWSIWDYLLPHSRHWAASAAALGSQYSRNGHQGSSTSTQPILADQYLRQCSLAYLRPFLPRSAWPQS